MRRKPLGVKSLSLASALEGRELQKGESGGTLGVGQSGAGAASVCIGEHGQRVTLAKRGDGTEAGGKRAERARPTSSRRTGEALEGEGGGAPGPGTGRRRGVCLGVSPPRGPEGGAREGAGPQALQPGAKRGRGGGGEEDAECLEGRWSRAAERPRSWLQPRRGQGASGIG